MRGREALAGQRRELRARLEKRKLELGFYDWHGYFDDRLHVKRWREQDAAHELGVPVASVRALMRRNGVSPARGSAPASEPDPDEYERRRLGNAQKEIAARRRARDDAIAARLGFPSVEEWYASRRAAGATARELMAESGMGEKWLRRLSRVWRRQHDRATRHGGESGGDAR